MFRNNRCCNYRWGEECDSLKNTFVFKLYDGKGNQQNWSDKAEVEGADGKAKKTFQDLKVLHQYRCGVEVITSEGEITTAVLKDKQTKIPQGIKTCTQPMVNLHVICRFSLCCQALEAQIYQSDLELAKFWTLGRINNNLRVKICQIVQVHIKMAKGGQNLAIETATWQH